MSEYRSYKIEVTMYFIENGWVIKSGNPESIISKQWVAQDKDEYLKVLSEIYDLKIQAITEERKRNDQKTK